MDKIITSEAKLGLLKLCESELFTQYKAVKAGVPVESVPAPDTSKSDHRNGVIGKRNGYWFREFNGYRCNANSNASQNIGQWLGFSCPLHLQEAVAVMAAVDTEGGVNDIPFTNEASKRADSSPAQTTVRILRLLSGGVSSAHPLQTRAVNFILPFIFKNR
ncbi:MAG TPA: hypothetical protein V6C93_32245 [Allocoleopsis sp.]